MRIIRNGWQLKIALALVLVFYSQASPAGKVSFEGLGVLQPGESSRGNGVSADGGAVVGFSRLEVMPSPDDPHPTNNYEAFRWTADRSMVGLGHLEDTRESEANAISADGSVAVGRSGWQAFRWTESGGMVGLGFLPGGFFHSYANGVSADGEVVVGGGSTPAGYQAFRWTESGGMVGLGFLPGSWLYSEANAVSADGRVVVGRSYSNAYEAFRWTETEGIVGLGFLNGGIASSALGVSANGSVVVGVCLLVSEMEEAFRWNEAGGMVGLGYLEGGNRSRASAVSGNGSVVVGYSESGWGREAFVWDAAKGMRSLRDVLLNLGLSDEIAGWDLYEATGISADGLTIVGVGYNPFGKQEAWRVVLGAPDGSLEEVVNLNYVSVATGVDFGPQDGVFDSFTTLNLGSVNNNGWTSFRTAFEFDLSGVPASIINSARLTMAVGAFEGARSIQIHGYAGSGAVQLGDFALNNIVATASVEPIGSQTFTFDVTNFVTDLAATNHVFAGFNVREEPANTENFVVMGIGLNNLPILSIEYSMAMTANIDIKPNGFPNSINPLSEGKIPVAILSSYMFDAPSKVDTTSLTFGRVGDEASLAQCNNIFEDVNGDGMLDLICHFDTKVTNFLLDDTQGVLKGTTLNGISFRGTDSVRIVK